MKITFATADGNRKTIYTPAEGSVMEAAMRSGIDEIWAECGGAATCGTCQVFVDPGWAGRLPAPGEDEQEILDMVLGRRPSSRLSCQIELDEALDGLVLELPAEQGLA